MFVNTFYMLFFAIVLCIKTQSYGMYKGGEKPAVDIVICDNTIFAMTQLSFFCCIILLQLVRLIFSGKGLLTSDNCQPEQ